MRNLYIITICAILCCISATGYAQSGDAKVKPFQHVGVSLNAGTLGIGLQGATSLNNHLYLRAGFSALPFKYNIDEEDATVSAKLNLYNAPILVDWFPSKKGKGFHLTAGVLIGSSKLVEMTATSKDGYGSSASESAYIKTNAIKPYAGIGFGRTIPKTRLGFKFELGAAFHGSPKMIISSMGNDPDLEESLNDANKTLSKITAWPVISFQLSYKIF